MTPKEKAKELIEKFVVHTKVFHQENGWEEYRDSAKQCAMIAVDEIISNINNVIINKDILRGSELYWREVRVEIGAIE